MRSRLVTLWVAYALLVATSWFGLWSIGSRINSLENDVCGAIVFDLSVQAEWVREANPELAAAIGDTIVDITEACGQ